MIVSCNSQLFIETKQKKIYIILFLSIIIIKSEDFKI